MKRFYRQVSLAALADGGHEVRLDGRPLRTPAKAALRLPALALAEAVAAEWAAQGEEIEPQSMPITRLANSAIDRVAAHRAEVVDQVAGFAATDLVCYRAATPQELAERQKAAWDPLLAWAGAELGAVLRTTSGVVPVAQEAGALAALRAPIEACDNFALAGLHGVVTAAGSLVIGLALAHGRLEVEAAWVASQVDEAFQIERWGEDEEATKARAALKSALYDAARFLDLCQRPR
jgi:chaperone required for assembly of F1-ATPase